MKIDKVIMSCDDNPLYADFWKPVSEVWKKRFDIDPVLIYFGDNKLDETFGQVIPVKPIEGIPSYAQAQWARFWFPTLELNTVQIISDIDMFPISRSFFIDQLEAIPDDQYVHLFGNHRPVPMCYHVAKGSRFKKVLQLDDTFENSIKRAYNSDTYTATHMGFDKWGFDESYSTKLIEEYDGKDLMLLNNPSPVVGITRLDRSAWEVNYSQERLKSYNDCHSLRPYAEHREEIDKLISQLLTSC
tara:strand:+ start:230 stop:961 length:732 start_codon:yes stop_codon:yes gene_type:complete